MSLASQTVRTFFVTSVTWNRHAVLQSDRMAGLLVDCLAQNRKKERFQLHEFVVMPNHFHLLLTPHPQIPLEKALQSSRADSPFVRRSSCKSTARSGKQASPIIALP